MCGEAAYDAHVQHDMTYSAVLRTPSCMRVTSSECRSDTNKHAHHDTAAAAAHACCVLSCYVRVSCPFKSHGLEQRCLCACVCMLCGCACYAVLQCWKAPSRASIHRMPYALYCTCHAVTPCHRTCRVVCLRCLMSIIQLSDSDDEHDTYTSHQQQHDDNDSHRAIDVIALQAHVSRMHDAHATRTCHDATWCMHACVMLLSMLHV